MFINYEEVKSNFAVELSGRHQPEQVIDINCIGINQNHVVSDRIQWEEHVSQNNTFLVSQNEKTLYKTIGLHLQKPWKPRKD